MKKRLITVLSTVAITVIMGIAAVACDTGKTPPEPDKHTHAFTDGICSCGKYEAPFINTLPVPEKLIKECDQNGTIEKFTYNTKDYRNNGTELNVEKKVEVYLPYGYDSSKKYNVLYLMHGAQEDEGFWFTKWGHTTLPVLDNMIKEKKCEPLILVSADYGDNGPQYFPLEFRNELVPLIETKYSTYLGSDTSTENMRATRDHRGFTGFSMGSVTSIEVLKQATDIVSYFGSLSVVLRTENPSEGEIPCQDIKDALEGEFKDYEIKYWLHMDGTADYAMPGHEILKDSLLKDMSDRFQDGKNFCWLVVKGGSHAYNCWIQGLYDSLLVFFK